MSNLFSSSMVLLGSALANQAGKLVAAPPEHGVWIAGTWEGRLHGIAVALVLEADGSGSINGESIRWRLSRGVLAIQGPEVQTYNVVQRDSKLVLFGGELEKAVTLARRGAAPSTKKPPQAPPKISMATHR